VPAAAALADLTLADCRNVLATLADQHLLESAAAGRFAMHDLLRIYAAERAVAEERPDECAAATRRVLSWYLHAADAATRVLAPRHPHVQLNPPDPCHPPPVFATHDQALDWCITEHTNLIAAVRQAMDTGELAVAWELPVALFGFFYLTKLWAEWIAMLQIGLTAARRGGDRHAEAWVAGSLGLAYWDLKDFKSARHHMKQALALCREAADQRGESLALTSLGLACRDLGHPDEALEYLQQALDLYRLTGDLWGTMCTPAVTFNANTTMNFNVFMAAAQLALTRVVWASSETTLGLPFDVPPRYAPVDEDHYPVPTTTYALSKVASETVAGHIARWSGIPFVALRFSNILGPADYKDFPSFWADPLERKWNLWGYIDERDAAAACRLALDVPATAVEGSVSFIIAAADTVMNRPSAHLLEEVFPGVPVTRELGEFGTLLAIDRARQVLGFEPQHSWRDHVPTDAQTAR